MEREKYDTQLKLDREKLEMDKAMNDAQISLERDKVNMEREKI